jgi:hypothetical protein
VVVLEAVNVGEDLQENLVGKFKDVQLKRRRVLLSLFSFRMFL